MTRGPVHLVAAALVLALTTTAPATSCPADTNYSAIVDVDDLIVVIIAWGTDDPAADVNASGIVDVDDLVEVILAWGPCPGVEVTRYFGRYSGSVLLQETAFYSAGVYPASAVIGQSASGVVGYLNIVVDPGDVLGGTITHTFSAPLRPGAELEVQYSDRICGAGDPLELCYPHCAAGCVQYSFAGDASLRGDELLMTQPQVLADLPYDAASPFVWARLTRAVPAARTTFDGAYANLFYEWMGTAIFPVPLPLFGDNQVQIARGQIVQWTTNGFDVPIAGIDPAPVIGAWCFDDELGLGWMNQQGAWHYDWVLDPDGHGVCVIVTFSSGGSPCGGLADPLAGAGLDDVHRDLVGIMIEQ